MAFEQTILFTVMPRGVGVDADTLPISVLVSPRLTGGTLLGQFHDWLSWTARLAADGLRLTLRCDETLYEVDIDRRPLRPDLWRQLFNEHTLVRSHEYDDYSKRPVLSYSVRQTLSALKALYQHTGVFLALPDAHGDSRGELRGRVEGLDVHWNDEGAEEMRAVAREMSASQGGVGDVALDPEGLIVGPFDPSQLKMMAARFAVYHHMPTPKKWEPLTLDTDELLDFHQGLSSLNVYPELQRALGLVFDLDLPRHLVHETGSEGFGRLSVASVGREWSTATITPALTTAYAFKDNDGQRLFFTAPRSRTDAPVTNLGMLDLDPWHFGLAQVDVDGGMHKAIILAEALRPGSGQNKDAEVQPVSAPHPEVFDPGTTLPALRSGGFSLFADARARRLLDELRNSKALNDAVMGGGPQPSEFFAEDLVRGYRLDVWDSRTEGWHSLHLRSGNYLIGDREFVTDAEEGFVQMAVTQPVKDAGSAIGDLYLHEAIARWSGWSLSAPRPGKHLSRYADAQKAVPPDGHDPEYLENQPDTPFKMKVEYDVLPGSLPSLRFGVRYRFRARAVDLAGNSMAPDSALAETLASGFALPRDPEGAAYLRYEPVGAPLVVPRDVRAMNGPGSAIDRIVIRTFNDATHVGPAVADRAAADTSAADRHILPPGISVEMGERLGMFDDENGKLRRDAATWRLIAERDAGELQHVEVEVAGARERHPFEPDVRVERLPYLPDPLAYGAALRDLPGAPSGSVGSAGLRAGAAGAVGYEQLDDPNPRPGSATLIRFADGDWRQTRGFRLVLAELAPERAALPPEWDPRDRTLTVRLPKGQTHVVPLSSYLNPADLRLMGVWQWLRDYIDQVTTLDPRPPHLSPGDPVDRIAHILQRALEGGHWMLNPPQLLTLVHAVQQPLGRPVFTALNVEHDFAAGDPGLQTAPIAGEDDPTEMAAISAHRRLDATETFLLGALRVHGASTNKVDLLATWSDPVDDPTEKTWTTASYAAHVDELRLPGLDEGRLLSGDTSKANSPDSAPRFVGYYDPEHDQIAFVRKGDYTGTQESQRLSFAHSAPRHQLNDTKHHRVSYTAVATSRYREYFPQDRRLDFTRRSEPVHVHVPASARPLAPSVAYVVPTFGWQRQTGTNIKRSVRFGSGLRVYLHRGWFSSGEGEMLGVALYSDGNGALTPVTRDKFKNLITQWGMDPIWQTGALYPLPNRSHFPGAVEDYGVTLEERSAARSEQEPGRIDVAAFPVTLDEERGLLYADVAIETFSATYMPFVRLALVRYQPHALADAKVSRVVLADFAQLTPDRAAMVTSDPHHPRTLRVVVSGLAPRGPQAVVRSEPQPPNLSPHPTQFRVRVQQHDSTLDSDLAWHDVDPNEAVVDVYSDGTVGDHPDFALWEGKVVFARPPQGRRFRLVIEEHEFISAVHAVVDDAVVRQPGRLIYAEIFELNGWHGSEP